EKYPQLGNQGELPALGAPRPYAIILAVTGTRAPHPTGPLFTIGAAALIFHVSEERVRNLLSQHRARFGPSMYRQVERRRRDYRYYRLQSEDDLTELGALFPVLIRERRGFSRPRYPA